MRASHPRPPCRGVCHTSRPPPPQSPACVPKACTPHPHPPNPLPRAAAAHLQAKVVKGGGYHRCPGFQRVAQQAERVPLRKVGPERGAPRRGVTATATRSSKAPARKGLQNAHHAANARPQAADAGALGRGRCAAADRAQHSAPHFQQPLQHGRLDCQLLQRTVRGSHRQQYGQLQGRLVQRQLAGALRAAGAAAGRSGQCQQSGGNTARSGVGGKVLPTRCAKQAACTHISVDCGGGASSVPRADPAGLPLCPPRSSHPPAHSSHHAPTPPMRAFSGPYTQGLPAPVHICPIYFTLCAHLYILYNPCILCPTYFALCAHLHIRCRDFPPHFTPSAATPTCGS